MKIIPTQEAAVASQLIAVLPKTGQTNSVIAGDDGDYECGVNYPNRFVDNNDGTITDTYTKLMWIKDTTHMITGPSVIPSNVGTVVGDWVSGTTYHPGEIVFFPTPDPDTPYVCVSTITSTDENDRTNTTYFRWIGEWAYRIYDADGETPINQTGVIPTNWTDAIAKCEELKYAGHEDWRLPNLNEAMSLYMIPTDLGSGVNTINSLPSPFVRGRYQQLNYTYLGVWTSSTCYPTTSAITVGYTNSSVVTVSAKNTSSKCVFPVRGGKL